MAKKFNRTSQHQIASDFSLKTKPEKSLSYQDLEKALNDIFSKGKGKTSAQIRKEGKAIFDERMKKYISSRKNEDEKVRQVLDKDKIKIVSKSKTAVNLPPSFSFESFIKDLVKKAVEESMVKESAKKPDNSPIDDHKSSESLGYMMGVLLSNESPSTKIVRIKNILKKHYQCMAVAKKGSFSPHEINMDDFSDPSSEELAIQSLSKKGINGIIHNFYPTEITGEHIDGSKLKSSINKSRTARRKSSNRRTRNGR